MGGGGAKVSDMKRDQAMREWKQAAEMEAKRQEDARMQMQRDPSSALGPPVSARQYNAVDNVNVGVAYGGGGRIGYLKEFDKRHPGADGAGAGPGGRRRRSQDDDASDASSYNVRSEGGINVGRGGAMGGAGMAEGNRRLSVGAGAGAGGGEGGGEVKVGGGAILKKPRLFQPFLQVAC